MVELSVRLDETRPQLLAITDTWLPDDSRHLEIPGYRCAGRKDRENQKAGGVALYVRENGLHVSELFSSNLVERMFSGVHTDVGLLGLCVWYRPPKSEFDELPALDEELLQIMGTTVGVVIVGDMNIHHAKWLRFSNGNSAAGELFHTTCKTFGLRQMVRQPARGKYLLDLVLSSLPDETSVRVLSSITDHQLVFVNLRLPTSSPSRLPRTVWLLSDDNLKKLKKCLWKTNWRGLITGDVDVAAHNLTNKLAELLTEHVPSKEIQEDKSSVPWVNDKCRQTITRKNAARGADVEKNRG